MEKHKIYQAEHKPLGTGIPGGVILQLMKGGAFVFQLPYRNNKAKKSGSLRLEGEVHTGNPCLG